MSDLDDGKRKQIRARLDGAISARDALEKRIATLKSKQQNVKALERSLAAYERDIKRYKKTLRIS
jgi:hypothetical protein